MNRIGYMLTVLVLFSASFFGGCGNKGGKLVEIKITPPSTIIATGTSIQYRSLAVFGDGTIVNWTSATEWTSSDNAVEISNAFNTFGLAHSFQSVLSGTVVITGKDVANNIVSTATLSVVDPVSLSIYPPNPFMKVTTNHSFRAETLLSTDPTVTPQVLTSLSTWTTTDSAIATVSKVGVVVTHLTGTTDLISTYTYTKFDGALYSHPTVTATTTLTVTATELGSLTLTSSPSVTSSVITVGTGTVQFGAIGNYNGGVDQIPFTESVSWYSSNKKVATISDDPGSKGFCTLVGAGSTTIRATDPITGQKQAVIMTVQ